MRYFSKKSLIAIGLAVALLIAAPAIQPAKAFLGIGDTTIVLIDLKEFVLELTKSFAASMLNNATNRYVVSFVNKALGQFQIHNQNAYVTNLANMIFSDPELKTLPSEDQFVFKSLINTYNGVNGGNVDLTPIYTKKATDVCNVFNVNNSAPGPDTYLMLSKCSDPGAVPAYQQTLAIDASHNLNAASQQKAALQTNASLGTKSIYSCKTGTINSIADCDIAKGANFINQQVGSHIASVFNSEDNPGGDKYTQYIEDAAKIAGNALGNGLFSSSFNGAGSTLVNDVIKLPFIADAQKAAGAGGANNPAAAAPYALTKFKAADSSGTVLAGFGTTANSAGVISGDAVIFSWDASAVPGASKVVFTRDSTPSDQPLTGRFTATVTSPTTLTSGSVAPVFGVAVMSASGQTLASDTISVLIIPNGTPTAP